MNQTKSISRDVNQIREFVGRNKLFSARFIKKDGTERLMSCRLGVTKYLKGGELNYDPIEKNLLPVYDVQNEGYRMINISTLIELKANKETLTWTT
jgi:hypothetical protein